MKCSSEVTKFGLIYFWRGRSGSLDIRALIEFFKLLAASSLASGDVVFALVHVLVLYILCTSSALCHIAASLNCASKRNAFNQSVVRKE